MSLPLRASAPGKLMLCGEYAVLYGAPAVATSVGPRANVVVSRSDSGSDQVQAPGLLAGRRRFTRDPHGAIRWEDAEADPALRLFQNLLETTPTSERYGSERCPLEFSLDTRSFWSGSRKLGLGSSAALSVALQALLQRLSGSTETAHAAHQNFQSGLGSGADLAVCEAGGVQRFQRVDDVAVSQALEWPGGLHMVVVDTGVAQSTAPMIAKLRDWLAASRRGDGLLRGLLSAAESAAAAFTQSATDFLSETVVFADRLQALDEAAEIGIYAGGHDRLRELALLAGVVYKPSGAGGGDIGIAFSDKPSSIDEFRSACIGNDFDILDLEYATEGLTVS